MHAVRTMLNERRERPLVHGEGSIDVPGPALHAARHIHRVRNAQLPQPRHRPLRVVAPPAHDVQWRDCRRPRSWSSPCRRRRCVLVHTAACTSCACFCPRRCCSLACEALPYRTHVAVKVLVGRVQGACSTAAGVTASGRAVIALRQAHCRTPACGLVVLQAALCTECAGCPGAPGRWQMLYCSAGRTSTSTAPGSLASLQTGMNG